MRRSPSSAVDNAPPRRSALSLVALLFLCGTCIGETTENNEPPVPLPVSINALMVALVDWSAHEIWDASYADVLTGRDWLLVRQHAIKLASSGTLLSLGGTGEADKVWVTAPAWQEYTRELTKRALDALAAVEVKDQVALRKASEAILGTCLGCHDTFKPETPTEGIMHVPHHDYGDPSIVEPGEH